MSVEQLIQHEMFTRPASKGSERFLRSKIEIDYKGKNSLGSHDSVLNVYLYEPIEDEKRVNPDMNLVQIILQAQISADNLPDLWILPNFYHNIDKNDDGKLTHRAYVWDENVSNLDLDLSPIYKLEKFLFIKEKFISPDKMYNAHLLVSSLQ